MAASVRNQNDCNQQILVSDVTQQSNNNNNNNNNNLKEKIIIQNQMIINVPQQQSRQQQQQPQQQPQQQHQLQHQEQQQQHIVVGNNQSSSALQTASLFSTAVVTPTATPGPFNSSINNNHEMSNIIAASPTAATYFQAQLASSANINNISTNATLDQTGSTALAHNRFPLVAYNGSNYCVITRGSSAADEQQFNEKQDVMVHFRGHLFSGNDMKPTNIILMPPIPSSCDQMMTTTDYQRKALIARATSN